MRKISSRKGVDTDTWHECTPIVGWKETHREGKEKNYCIIKIFTEKRDGTIKERQCADERKQKQYKMKEESTSPTVTTEAVPITSVIDATENRSVAVVDLLGAFLHAENFQDTIMFMRGRLAELMTVKAPQTYWKYLTIECGQKVLYVKVQKALYGILKSTLLFHKRWEVTESVKVIMNPYDPCVAYKMINLFQMTLIWHIDDLKISYKKLLN